jgi:hypothetical protein
VATLRIKAKPYAGDYRLDIDEEPLTTLEWRWIKRISGYLPATIREGVKGGDPDINIALAVIAMARAGRIAEADVTDVADRLARASIDNLEEIPDPSEELGEDPTTPPGTGSLTPNGGSFGNSTSENPDNLPPPTGPLDLRRFAESSRATSPP